MKTKVALLTVAAACSLFTFNDAIYAQGTAFTYQGRLNSGTNAANGSFDVQFTLFSAGTGGSSVAGPVVKTAIGVTNGLFTTTVDFGGVFPGTTNWLELAVRTNGAASFSSPLVPRQQLTPTPYAVYAETANGAGLTGTISGNGSGLTSLSASQLSAGTVPDTRLSANVALRNANQTFSGSNTFNSSGISGNNTLQFGAGIAGQEDNAGKIGYETFTTDSLDIVGAGTNGSSRKIKFWAEGGALFNGPATISGTGTFNGNVGIGTSSPSVRLDIVGTGTSDDARLLVETTGGTLGPQLRLKRGGGEEWLFVNDGVANGPENALQIVQSSAGARLIIDPKGNVGIGTTTPQTTLDVYAPVYAQVAAQFGVANCGGACGQTDHQEAIRLWNQNGNGQVGIGFTVGGGSFSSNAVPGVWIGTAYGQNANDFKVATLTGTNLIDRFYISGTNGNITFDQSNLNGGTIQSNAVTFGSNSGEGIASKRTAGGTQFDLEFYTAGVNRLKIDNSGHVGIGTNTPNSDAALQINGKVRMGSETGTSEAPNRSILVRRINSTSQATGQVLARSATVGGNTMTLERDGSPGGLVLKISGTLGGSPQISGFGINASGAFVGVHSTFHTGSAYPSTQIFTDAQKIGYLRLSFGEALNESDLTTVELTRYVDNGANNDNYWIGTVTSTLNQ